MNYLELLDWRRNVAELFAELRRRPPDAETLTWFRMAKDRLFREHPQSPIAPANRNAFQALVYFTYDSHARVIADFTDGAHEIDPTSSLAIDAGEARLRPIGNLSFRLKDEPLRLSAYWLEGYAGGLFVPFRDVTSGRETYGGGRYLIDTAKGADFGSDHGHATVVLDFNYAYHPSCAYDPRFPCPLAPPENWLTVPVRAGERLPGSAA